MNPSRTETIKSFLTYSTHLDLAQRYHYNMEVQVNVAQDGGSRIESDFKGKQWHAWTNGVQVWKSFRIPYKASTEPEYEDVPMSYDLVEHAEGIGMTGWDWLNRKSLWVAFDFDAITGHSEKHTKKLSDIDLEEVKNRLMIIPWCSIRKSTSGKGLHIYIDLIPVPTANHNEHAALARSLLGALSALARFDFTSKVDACGGNMWVWHRKMKGTDGLELVKKQELLCTDIPPNWRDHIGVTSGKKRRTELDPSIEGFSNKSSKIPLDEEHGRLINWLKNANCSAWWNNDFWILVTHTYHLKRAHTELGLKGIFETLAEGTEAPNDHNCFLSPHKNGVWSVRRYSAGVGEHKTWDVDASGWTRTFLNKTPDLKAAARAYDGIENEKGGFSFQQSEMAQKAAALLGIKMELPSWISSRPAILKKHKDGRLIMTIEQMDGDLTQVTTGESLKGWLIEKKNYSRIYDVKVSGEAEIDLGTLDDTVRHLVGSGGDDCGWVVKTPDTDWRSESLTHVKLFLEAQGYSGKDATGIIGSSVVKCWRLVNIPFQPEYPEGRNWNRDAAQYKFVPTEEKDNLSFPTWLKILKHCGKTLDKDVLENKWCKDNAILTGAEYLKCWMASVLQQPLEPLPYLFFFGPEDSGKSIFHEAFKRLVTKGVVYADRALTDNYNGELANAVLCIVEETDLGKNKQANNKMKDWVTASYISIRAMYEAPYLLPNATHWVQCNNKHTACPIFPGDTRVTFILVEELSQDEMIPKKQLFPLLDKEAPDFLAELLSLELPQTNGRLNIPIISTQEKFQAVRANRTLLEEYIEEHYHYITGSYIKFGDFVTDFRNWLEPGDMKLWTPIKVGRELPLRFPHGRLMRFGAQFFIGNLSKEPFQLGQEVKPRLILKDGKLVEEL